MIVLVERLSQLQIRFCLVGSFAVRFYTDPRFRPIFGVSQSENTDLDVLLEHMPSPLNEWLTENRMIHFMDVEVGWERKIKIKYAPFSVWHLDSHVLQPENVWLQDTCVFVGRVGPIRADEFTFSSARRVQINSLDIPIAPFEFLGASMINPHAVINPVRRKRFILALFSFPQEKREELLETIMLKVLHSGYPPWRIWRVGRLLAQTALPLSQRYPELGEFKGLWDHISRRIFGFPG